MHGDAIYEEGTPKNSLEFWRQRTTDQIIASLLPNLRDSLKVRANGLIVDGNTRVRILIERGVEVNNLPREMT
jgi:hypothetical protein